MNSARSIQRPVMRPMAVDNDEPETEQESAEPMLRAAPRVLTRTAGVSATSSVTVERTPAPAASERATDLLSAGEHWTAQQLQDYVVRQIEERFGPQPDHAFLPKLNAIFGRFMKTWGSDAARIARFAFETQPNKGYWMGAPIKVGRFTKGNDNCFAQNILDRINR